jgi:hypothetical protein
MHCHGFRVDSPRRRLGIVEDVLYGIEPDRPTALAVRGGIFGSRVELVPIESVAAISPRLKRIRLRDLAPSSARRDENVLELGVVVEGGRA